MRSPASKCSPTSSATRPSSASAPSSTPPPAPTPSHAGAQFVVSPVFDPEIVATTSGTAKSPSPARFTPTEILRAWTAGADVVKVFPSTTLGPGYFKDVLAPLPQLRLTPTGGVDQKNAGDWIKAGAVFVGAGSSLVSKDAMAKGDWAAITNNAKSFVDAIKAARRKMTPAPLVK